MTGCNCPPDNCTCCVGNRVLTPADTENRPGLPALRYRVGTHGSFLSSMLAGIGVSPPLEKLTTRDPNDFTVALADAWASVLDVLTFYQERIANEGYLRTAVERGSVLDLAAEIGYRAGPGIAASVRLAFFLETAPGAPVSTTIPRGTKVQSLPGPGETPQTFETAEEITAHQVWNAVQARQTEPFLIEAGSTECYLAGISTRLKPGDYLLVLWSKQEKGPIADRPDYCDFRRLLTVQPDSLGRFTHVTWEKGPGSGEWNPPYAVIEVHALRTRAQLFGATAPDWTGMPTDVRTEYNKRHPATPIRHLPFIEYEWPSMSLKRVGTYGTATNPDKTLFLDAIYSQIIPGRWIVLARPALPSGASSAKIQHLVELYHVVETAEDSRTDFGYSAKTTCLKLEGSNFDEFDHYLRQTIVYCESESLPLADKPIKDFVKSRTETLNDLYDGTKPGLPAIKDGMPVMVSETRQGELFPFQQEIAWIKSHGTKDGLTTLEFTEDLRNTYSREGVRFNFNLAPATHGESRSEVLGSGDASRPNQSFVLKQRPLTYLSSATSEGRSSTLTVYINDVAWREVNSLYAQPPEARVFVSRIADNGEVALQAGDGIEGARLPTGIENLRAIYRTGTGLGGLVKAGQLSLLMTRPLGVKSVTNPEAPTGAEDPEPISEARQNAPLTAFTFGRIVSALDFERYTRAFPGISKARADQLWDGENRMVFLTVALDGDAPFDPNSPAITNLKTSLRSYGDPFFPFDANVCDKRQFRGSARIQIEEGRVFEIVHQACLAALAAAFSFEAGVLARSLSAAAVVAVLQSVPGVVGVDLETFRFDPAEGAITLSQRLDARPARWEGDHIEPAEMLLLAADGFEIVEMKP